VKHMLLTILSMRSEVGSSRGICPRDSKPANPAAPTPVGGQKSHYESKGAPQSNPSEAFLGACHHRCGIAAVSICINSFSKIYHYMERLK
jgi:hypothetical protein